MEEQESMSDDNDYQVHLDRVAAMPYPDDKIRYMEDFSDAPSPDTAYKPDITTVEHHHYSEYLHAFQRSITIATSLHKGEKKDTGCSYNRSLP